MRNVILPLLVALSAGAAAVPATAQPIPVQRWGYDHRDGGGDIYRRLDQIDIRVERGLQRGTITPREARRLRDRMNDIVRLERRYSWNGISPREWQELNRRVAVLQDRFARERWDDDRRFRRW